MMCATIRDHCGQGQEQDNPVGKIQRLERLNKLLEIRLAEANFRLHQREQMLFQQSRLAAMGEMIGNVTHQWLQPLNNIALLVQCLRQSAKSYGTVGADFTQYIDSVMQVIQNMSDTMNNFNKFFQQEKKQQVFPVARAVEQCVSLVADSLKYHYITIELELEENISVFGFKNEFIQALLKVIARAKENLLRKNRDNPCITIRAFLENNCAVVTVHDNGRAIDQGLLPQVFTSKKSKEGTGVGLYVARMIIGNKMKGRLTSYHTCLGTQIRIELPLCAEEASCGEAHAGP
jgi:signal transduction histidine kinase